MTMRLSHLLAATLLVVVGVTPAGAADLSKIDRTIPDEPAYQSRKPGYCLLVFGPEARTRVWLVKDGNAVHVHDSPDGKAPPRWRKVRSLTWDWPLGDIWEGGGTARHRDLHFNPIGDEMRLWLKVGGKRQLAGHDRRGALELAASAKDAPVVHFNGPLTLDLFREQRPLRSGRRVQLTAVVGTPGVGPGTFAVFDLNAYPRGAWPTAVIEYPAKDGGAPIVAKVTLDDD
jgi:hypothetical protein